MLQTERDFTALERQCGQAVDLILARYQWRLLERQEFVRRTVVELRTDPDCPPHALAIHIYCQALYHACSGKEGQEWQEQGYEELFRYIYDSGHSYYADVCAEAAQQAIEKVFFDFDRCHQPGTFLAWALQCFRDAARSLRKQEQQQPQSLEAPVGEGPWTLGEILVQEQPELDAPLIAEEQRARLEQLIALLRAEHPHALRQFATLRLKYIDGLDDAMISQRLGIPVTTVYVLRSRAIKRLQAELPWMHFATECGILKED